MVGKAPLPAPCDDKNLLAQIEHFMFCALRSKDLFASPREAAEALVKRIAFEGYVIIKGPGQ